MLPSKGYFRSVDCPFYANNLCHRFYCHFRHIKKATANDLDINILCEESVQDLLTEDKDFTEKNTVSGIDMPALPTEEPKYSTSKKVSSNEELKNKSYLLPENIPKYNPTPISKLKTRHKHTIKNELHPVILGMSDKLCTPDIDKDSTIETLVSYFVEGNTLKDSGTKDNNNINQTCLGIAKETIQCPPSLVYGNIHTNVDTVDMSNVDAIIQENLKLKEIVLQLKGNPDNKELNRKELLDNKTLLMDLMGYSESSTENKEYAFSKNTDDEFTNKNTNIHKLKMDDQRKKKRTNFLSNNNIRNRNHFKLNRSKTKHKSSEPNNNKPMKLKDCSEILSDNFKKVKNQESPTINVLTPEIIDISDSENEDENIITNYTSNSIDSLSKCTINNVPEPKQKIRISHVKEHSALIDRNFTCTTSNNLYMHQITPKDKGKQDYPNVRKRLAHSLNYNTLSIQSVKDHLSHWQRVRDRVQRKCVNSNGEEGFQNWSKVKISPVPNVMSMIHSKNLLYSKINEQKSSINN